MTIWSREALGIAIFVALSAAITACDDSIVSEEEEDLPGIEPQLVITSVEADRALSLLYIFGHNFVRAGTAPLDIDLGGEPLDIESVEPTAITVHVGDDMFAPGGSYLLRVRAGTPRQARDSFAVTLVGEVDCAR